MDHSTPEAVYTTDLPGVRLLARGKVRDIYDLGDRLLLVASDRLSAFDNVLPDRIPPEDDDLVESGGSLTDVFENLLEILFGGDEIQLIVLFDREIARGYDVVVFA